VKDDIQTDPRRWRGLFVLLAGAFLPPLDFFIVNVALPSIREDFHASPSLMQLVISGYATTYAVMLITGGRLGDLYGRRNTFLAGMALFAIASIRHVGELGNLFGDRHYRLFCRSLPSGWL
jgi:MFS family permease